MPIYGGVRTTFVQLEPKDPSTVPVGSLFIDSTNSNQATIKPVDNSTPDPIQGQGSPANYFIKSAISGGAFANKATISKNSDGRVVGGDADVNAAAFIGYAMAQSTGAGQTINIFLAGPNLAGYLIGLGFLPGDAVYLDQVAGQIIKDISGFGQDDAIIQLGIADCADGIASSEATDLISMKQNVSLP